MLPDSRECRKCGIEKPLPEFSKAARGKYGRKASCKACDAARHAAQFVPQPCRPLRPAPSLGTAKTCRKCGITKTLADFSLSRQATATTNGVYRSDCKECCSARALQWFRDNKERHKETKHRWTLAKNYGLSPDEYAAMLEAQGGVCAICGQAETKRHGRTGTEFRLAVDHCHQTGRVRGLLCQTCNRVIGLFKDDVERHQRAIDYLLRQQPERDE
ncbi:endonuclease VII domain-containing protein [Streptomyces sp. NPDC059385]|uniref:endonuclease VII domain-containing protein n=1 Tax=Streptomyces sp. NPDC059385 TaxID=3346817 RepID=UPI0036C862C7